ncbi:hypothetical protein K2X05_06935 [bacterium]|nr:hypothetical protein [bacterium]
MTKLVFLMLVLSSLQAMAKDNGQNQVKEIAVGVNGVYVASDLKSTADVVVVVNGLFPNGCYSLGEPKIDNKSNFEHDIYTMAKVKQGICLRVLVPFTKEISIGKLAVGKHNLRFVADDGTAVEKIIDVK